MVLRILDLETTGVDPEADAIIEIAAVQLGANCTVAAVQERLVDPRQPIPPESSAVHGLIDEDVAGKPLLRDVIELFDGADAYIAHNSKFEESFLTPIWGSKVWIDTFRCALRVWPDAPRHNNEALRYWLGLVNPLGIPRAEIRPHRALSDCYVTGAIFGKLLEQASWAQLRDWSREPALFTRFSFGKHKGERFDAVPADYLDWIIRKSDLDDDVKFSARHWLEQSRTKAAA